MRPVGQHPPGQNGDQGGSGPPQIRGPADSLRGQGDPLHPLVPKDPSIPVSPVSPVKDSGLTSPRGTVSSLGFPSSNGASAEALFAFHDFLFVFLLPILVGVFSYILILMLRFPSFRLLLDCQPLEFL